jgi:hypothetical protein
MNKTGESFYLIPQFPRLPLNIPLTLALLDPSALRFYAVITKNRF